MRKILFLLLFSVIVYSQNNVKEFQGIIKYSHKVIPKVADYNVEYDYAGLGKKSDYYYKNGNYKFVNYDGYFDSDLFKTKELKNYLSLSKSDTTLVVNSRITDIEILESQLKKGVTTILGHKCDMLLIKLKPVNEEGPISYRRYFFSNKLKIDSNHFKSCLGNAYEFIFEKTKALPLKIEFEWPNRTIIWEAYEVKEQMVNDETFDLKNNRVLVPIN